MFSVPGPKAKEEVLSGATDWKVQFDIDVTDGASLGYLPACLSHQRLQWSVGRALDLME